MRKVSDIGFFVAGLSLAIACAPARAAEPVNIPMTADHWTTLAGTVNFV